MKRTLRKIGCLPAVLGGLLLAAPASGETPDRAATIHAAEGVLTRVMGEDAVSRMQLGLLPPADGRDLYEYSPGKVELHLMERDEE